MAESNVIFTGGPLHGQVLNVPEDSYGYRVLEPQADILDEASIVTYRFTNFRMGRRIIRIGYLGGQPDEDLVFEVVMSDKAKEAAAERPLDDRPSGEL